MNIALNHEVLRLVREGLYVPVVLSRQIHKLARNASALQGSERSQTLTIDDTVVLSAMNRQLRSLPLVGKCRWIPLLLKYARMNVSIRECWWWWWWWYDQARIESTS